jgi:phosphoribosylformimino-5-aminoimidazole carboxamide ribotide isomerase
MIIPAIDLIDGAVVRLYQGDYAQKTQYSVDPVTLVNQYADEGAKWLHIVDLTGAKDTSKRQLTLIKAMADSKRMQFQAGGGVRTEDDVKQLLASGVSRVVIGSLAVQEPELVKSWINKYGTEAIVLALDININQDGKKCIATHGWQKDSGVELEPLVNDFLSVGLKHVLCTDIDKDGTLQGPNQQLYKELAAQFPSISWQASGGISCLDDITQLKPSLINSGTANATPSGVILGRSLLEGKFSVSEALTSWEEAKSEL